MPDNRKPDLLSTLAKIFPFLRWFRGYNFSHLRNDFISGVTVALVLVPQSMAYAQLAGLPAFFGLYAAFLPPMLASLFGSSRQLATGPVAVVSLMTAAALEPIATAGSEMFILYAILLALLVGIFQFLLGVLKLGKVVNFLSHPVVNGFTNAAAIIIATSQLSKLFGVNVDKAEHHFETIYNVVKVAIVHTHWPTLGLAVLSFVIIYGLRQVNRRIPNVLFAVAITTLISWSAGFEKKSEIGINQINSEEVRACIDEYNHYVILADSLSEFRVELGAKREQAKKEYGEHSIPFLQAADELDIINLEISKLREEAHLEREKIRNFYLGQITDSQNLSTFFQKGDDVTKSERIKDNWHILVNNGKINMDAIKISSGGDVVGIIPQGLPGFKTPRPDLSIIFKLIPAAIIISLLGFMEAISIAKAMAAKTGQRLNPNQELIGQGLANIVGSMFQSYSVSGSFSRSAVNIQAGAFSGLSNVFSSAVVVIVLLLLTPLLYHLPQAVLATIIMAAVIGLVNVKGFVHAWKVRRSDGIISIITFALTLIFAPHLEWGILVGVLLSVILYLMRVMKPEIALLSRHPDGTWRNSRRFHLKKCKYIAVIRYSGSIFFANTNYLEEKMLDMIQNMPELKHVILVGNGINELDASGEEMLSLLVERFQELGLEFSITGLNDPVIDILKKTYLYERIGENHIFRNVARALEMVHSDAHVNSDEKKCPLIHVMYKREMDSD
jgi:SulP family sulfate permease